MVFEFSWEALTSLSTLFLALVAFYGLRSWRVQHIGRRRLEVGEQVRQSFHASLASLIYIRTGSQAVHGQFLQHDTEFEEGKTSLQYKADAVLAKMESHSDVWVALLSQRAAAAIYFGGHLGRYFDQMYGAYQDTRVAAEFVQRRDFVDDVQQGAISKETVEDLRRKLFGSISKYDKIHQSANQALEGVELTLMRLG